MYMHILLISENTSRLSNGLEHQRSTTIIKCTYMLHTQTEVVSLRRLSGGFAYAYIYKYTVSRWKCKSRISKNSSRFSVALSNGY